MDGTQVSSPEQIGESADQQSAVAVTPLQQYFLIRLEQLVAKREQQLRVDTKDKQALRLLARALYATYMDCVANGVGDQAASLLDKAQHKGAAEPTVRAAQENRAVQEN